MSGLSKQEFATSKAKSEVNESAFAYASECDETLQTAPCRIAVFSCRLV
jgi:hypothetical protein